jgi:ornithine cyclodeaminase/alanine dehydrogenase-like protein (mu-crystallin family)
VITTDDDPVLRDLRRRMHIAIESCDHESADVIDEMIADRIGALVVDDDESSDGEDGGDG